MNVRNDYLTGNIKAVDASEMSICELVQSLHKDLDELGTRFSELVTQFDPVLGSLKDSIGDPQPLISNTSPLGGELLGLKSRICAISEDVSRLRCRVRL